MFVDCAGTKPEVVVPITGEVLKAELFVAVLGASSYTYAEATWTQSLPDWIGAYTRTFASSPAPVPTTAPLAPMNTHAKVPMNSAR